jgi:hypothetical protein
MKVLFAVWRSWMSTDAFIKNLGCTCLNHYLKYSNTNFITMSARARVCVCVCVCARARECLHACMCTYACIWNWLNVMKENWLRIGLSSSEMDLSLETSRHTFISNYKNIKQTWQLKYTICFKKGDYDMLEIKYEIV